jgi:hypothetical protein
MKVTYTLRKICSSTFVHQLFNLVGSCFVSTKSQLAQVINPLITHKLVGVLNQSDREVKLLAATSNAGKVADYELPKLKIFGFSGLQIRCRSVCTKNLRFSYNVQ